MCGITGIYAYGPAADRVDREEVCRIRDYMAARGPDGAGEWQSPDGRIMFGHRRLAIIDLSENGAQPMQSADGRFVVTFNGEIYNYKSLRSELEAEGYRFRTQSDTEVLLQLYAAIGTAMVERLRGMFAFAIWDVEKQGLLLARDSYGVKPLYYTDTCGTVRFASQVKALLAGRRVSHEPDPAGWVGFHLLGSVPEPFTSYREIRAVSAGSTLWIDVKGAKTERRYFHLSEIFRNAEEHRRDGPTSELQEQVQAALLDSVRHHMIADVPVGIFLSAGVDSGALLGLMRDAGQEKVEAVTLAYEEYRHTQEDEVPLAANCATHYGSKHTIRMVTAREFGDDLPKILTAMDQPTIDGINTWFVSKAARELGLKAVISGLGGDEIFGGYPSFRDVPRWLRFCAVPAHVPILGDAFRCFADQSGLANILNPKVAGALKFGGSYAGAYFLRRGLFMPWELTTIMDRDVVAEGLRSIDPIRHIAKALEPTPRTAFGKVAALEASLYMRNQLLRDTDWASMAHSLEVRVPLVDAQLLKAIAPSVVGLPIGTGKRLLASCPRSPLPAEIVERSKSGFGTPIAMWLLEDSRLQKWRNIPQLARPRCPWARRWAYQLAAAELTAAGAFGPGDQAPSRAGSPKMRADFSAETVLIFRIGSLGDTVVALPCFHRIARSFPNSRRIIVTDSPASKKVTPVEVVLGDSGLIHGAIYFPPPPRKLRDLLTLGTRIRQTGATTMIYVADRNLPRTLRDVYFFRTCGIRKFIGAPIAHDLRRPRTDSVTGETEREAERLARCLSLLGPIDLCNSAMWDLRLRPNELHAADVVLTPLQGKDFVAVSLGGKKQTKDWGGDNWTSLFHMMASRYSDMGLVFIGSADEFDRCAGMAAQWEGPSLNVCGRLSPRVSAGVMQRARFYLGHDSGPMHLAAAVGIPCVAMFGPFNAPKRWHPMGAKHHIIHNMHGILKITPDDVLAAIDAVMSEIPSQVGAQSAIETFSVTC